MGFKARRMLMQRPEISEKAFDHKIAKIVCSNFFIFFFNISLHKNTAQNVPFHRPITARSQNASF